MDIHITTRHLDRTQGLIESVRRRAAYAFSRFADAIERVDLRIADVNGPRGGMGIACLARVHLGRGGSLEVEQIEASPEAGAVRAIDRLASRMRRHLDRLHNRH